MEKLRTKLPPKGKLAAILSLSFATAFMLFFFTPLELYFNSPSDFIVGWKFLTPILLALSFTMFAAISLVVLFVYYKKTIAGISLITFCAIAILCLRFAGNRLIDTYIVLLASLLIAAVAWVILFKIFKDKAIDVILLVFFGVVIAAYIQVLLLNGNIIEITGDAAPSYNDITVSNVLNIIVWVVITLLPVTVWAYCQKRGKRLKYEFVIVFSTLLICAMQAVGIASLAIITPLPEGLEDNQQYLSYEPVLHFSKDKNIMVFIMDRLDVNYMIDTLKEYPNLQNNLDGFTFYQNNIAEFGFTFPSITTMLTNNYYTDGLNFDKYWTQAWSEDNYITTLKENGFTTNLLLDKSSTYGNISDLENVANNIVTITLKHSFKETAYTMGNLSLIRLAPYFAKNIFLSNITFDFGNSFYTILEPDGMKNMTVGRSSDTDFYRFLMRNNISASSKNPVFNAIHLNCAHVDRDKSMNVAGYHYVPETEEILQIGNYVESTYACFMILDKYFDKMKESKVFDNTTIIIVGDHGRANIELSEKNPAVATALFIKPANEHGTLKINTKDELSNKYLPASVLDYAGIQHSELGVSYNDVIESKNYPIRRYHEYTAWWTASINSKTIFMNGYYDISGDAQKFKNWKYTPIKLPSD